LLDEDDFGEAFNRVYDLVWNKFADWYLEASKSELNLTVLAWALDTVLKLAHPFAPFCDGNDLAGPRI
jgi:valyl-tRNA synthetase